MWEVFIIVMNNNSLFQFQIPVELIWGETYGMEHHSVFHNLTLKNPYLKHFPPCIKLAINCTISGKMREIGSEVLIPSNFRLSDKKFPL